MKQTKTWTYPMYRQVIDEYPFKGTALAKEMGVNMTTLEEKAQKLDVSCSYELTPEETEYVKRYGRTLGKATVFLMPNHTPTEINRALCDVLHA